MTKLFSHFMSFRLLIIYEIDRLNIKKNKNKNTHVFFYANITEICKYKFRIQIHFQRTHRASVILVQWWYGINLKISFGIEQVPFLFNIVIWNQINDFLSLKTCQWNVTPICFRIKNEERMRRKNKNPKNIVK